jgi:uncharacterized protein YggE
MTLGRPLSIREGVQEFNTGQREAFAAPPAALVQVPVEPGETTVEAVVSVVFEAS